MGRAMGLDVGEKVIGVALSDEAKLLAFPAAGIRTQEGYRRDMAAIRQVVEQSDVDEVVVGMPIMLDGSHGVQAAKIEDFVGKLRRYISVPIALQDERLSTAEAERVLIAASQSREERKRAIDSMAACIFLQAYLDRKRATQE